MEHLAARHLPTPVICMTAHYSHGTGTIRFYPPGKCYEAMDDFDGVVSVKWIDDRTVELHAGHGSDGVKRLAEAIEILKPLGACRFRVRRKMRRRMPRPWRIIESDKKSRVWELDLSDA